MSSLVDSARRTIGAMKESIVQYVINESEVNLKELGRPAIAMQSYLKLRAAHFDHESTMQWIWQYFKDECASSVEESARLLGLAPEVVQPEVNLNNNVMTEAREIYNRVNDDDPAWTQSSLSFWAKIYEAWPDPDWCTDSALRTMVDEYIRRYSVLEQATPMTLFIPSAGVKGVILSWLKERLSQLREEGS